MYIFVLVVTPNPTIISDKCLFVIIYFILILIAIVISITLIIHCFAIILLYSINYLLSFYSYLTSIFICFVIIVFIYRVIFLVIGLFVFNNVANWFLFIVVTLIVRFCCDIILVRFLWCLFRFVIFIVSYLLFILGYLLFIGA